MIQFIVVGLLEEHVFCKMCSLCSSFWSSSIWLPPTVTWESIEQQKVFNEKNDETENYAEFGDLLYSIPLAFTIMMARFAVEKWVFRPLGLWLGLKDTKYPFPAEKTVLNEAFKKSSVVSAVDMETLQLKSGLSGIEVQFEQSEKSEQTFIIFLY